MERSRALPGMNLLALPRFREHYNTHISGLVSRLSDAALERSADSGGPAPRSLQEIVTDCVAHQELNLRHSLPEQMF